MKQKLLIVPASLAPALLLRPALGLACSVCLTGANDASADAFNWSVLFLMATPYSVVGTIVGWLVYRYRRAAAKRQEEESAGRLVHMAWNEKESGR